MYNLDNSYPTSLNLAIRIPKKNTDSVASQFEKLNLTTFRNFATKKKRKDIFVIIYLATWQVHVLLPCVTWRSRPTVLTMQSAKTKRLSSSFILPGK
jgi:hypothetical protein